MTGTFTGTISKALWALTFSVTLGGTAAVAQQAASDLPIGTVDGQVAETPLGALYPAASFGDWEIRCMRVEEGQPEPCQLYQLLLDDGDTPAAEFNLFQVPNDGTGVIAGAQVTTPLDTLIAQPLRLQVDDGPVLTYPFTYCQTFGCVVRMGLTGENITSFERGGEAVVTIVPLAAPDQIVRLVLSLSGFTAAYEDLSARQQIANELAQALQEAASE